MGKSTPASGTSKQVVITNSNWKNKPETKQDRSDEESHFILREQSIKKTFQL